MGKRPGSRSRTIAPTRPFSPGLKREFVVSEPSANYCKVSIAEVGVTLVFQREDAGIRCTGHEIDDPDIAPKNGRVSAGDFAAARQRAVVQMNRLRGNEVRHIETRAQSEPSVYEANLASCVLSYGNSHYEFACPVEQPLTWQNLQYDGAVHWLNRVFLTDDEFRKLKQRAFSAIKSRRSLTGTYGNDGLQPFVETKQLKLALTA